MQCELTLTLTRTLSPGEREQPAHIFVLPADRPANPVARTSKDAGNASPSPWGEGRDEGGQKLTSRSQPFTTRQVVAVPAAQGGVAGAGKEKLQRRRFNVA